MIHSDSFARLSKYVLLHGKAIILDLIIPCTRKGSIRLKEEIIRIHQRQNLFSKMRSTFLDSGIGLMLALMSARVVERFFEVKGAQNLWGLWSRNTVVSENTFIALTFLLECFVAFIVFTAFDHYLGEYRKKHMQDK